MGRVMNIKQAKIMAYAVDVSFLVIHILLFLTFRKYGVTPMMYFNIGSVLFYIFLPITVYKVGFRTFCIAMYMEVVLHMSFAVYYTGWESGFQVTLLGMGILASYSEYAGRYLKIPYLHATPLSLVGMIAYIISCIIAHNHTAQYPLPDNITYMFSLAWGIITFSITLVFLYIFVKVSSDTEEILSSEVDHDQLTGLPNRYHLWDYLNSLDATGRLEKCWVAMVDIDDFKMINDTYGHNVGDQVLLGLAEMLKSSGYPWKVCRWGGEEFLITGMTEGDIQARVRELDEFRQSVEKQTFEFDGIQKTVTVTVGVAEYLNGQSIRDWIGEADRKLYEGKRSGKNKVIA